MPCGGSGGPHSSQAMSQAPRAVHFAAFCSREEGENMRFFQWSVLPGLLLFCAQCARAEVEINITADPPLPVPNLLVNADFSAGDAMPDGWYGSSPMPELFTFRRHADGGPQGGAFVRLEGRSSVMSGYLSQHVTGLQPETAYYARTGLRLRGGHALLLLNSYIEGRRWDLYVHQRSWGINPLVPDFVHLAYTDSPPPDEWIRVGEEFTTEPGHTELMFRVGAYFERTSMDIAEPFLCRARTTLEITVKGKGIRRVQLSDDQGKILWEKDDYPAGTHEVHEKLPDMTTLVRYSISVAAEAGETHKWYPE